SRTVRTTSAAKVRSSELVAPPWFTSASAWALLTFAAEVVRTVRDAFGVTLEREPRLLGVDG
ncbi:MAG: hypothetical protein AAF447_18250, partial [Myxococcota bacterium]